MHFYFWQRYNKEMKEAVKGVRMLTFCMRLQRCISPSSMLCKELKSCCEQHDKRISAVRALLSLLERKIRLNSLIGNKRLVGAVV